MTRPNESTEPNELEERLGAGLKRWAGAGEPTLDLEAYVRAQAAPPKRRPSWLRWMGTAAAAAALVVGLGATFPSWAGAASGWPLVGPVVTEIIMRDAGLKWAYDNDLLQGAVAEARDGEMTVRILGVMADSVRTVVIYQITGVAEPKMSWDGRPVRSGEEELVSRFSRPASAWPEFDLQELPGQLAHFVSHSGPMETPLGLVGTFTTAPLGVESGTIKLAVTFQEHTVGLSIPVSREETARFSRIVPVGQSQTVDEITVTVESLVQTPVETVVRYRLVQPEFHGSYSWENHEYSAYMEGAGGREYGRPEFNKDGLMSQSFPAMEGSAKLVFPALVKGVAAELRWPLQKGAVAEARGRRVTLKDWTVSGNMLYLEWEHEASRDLIAFDPLEVLDAEGNAHTVEDQGSTWSTLRGVTNKAVQVKLPDGVTPVAVRTGRIAVGVEGPWVFDLPAR